MKNMQHSTYRDLVVGAAALAVLLSAGIASAQTTTPAPAARASWAGRGAGMSQMHRAPGVFGTVSAISGDTLTVSSRGPGQSAAAISYSVDASGATVMKDNATSTLSSVAVGDTVMVQGTVSGTSVTAAVIREGLPQGGAMGKGAPGTKPAQGPMIPANGEPVVGGSISAISGDTLTVANKAGVTYSVDVSSAFVEKGNATSSVSSVAVGDDVLIQGTVHGTSVSATSIIDQGVPPSASNGTGGLEGKPGLMGGVFGAIGGFFRSLFGFF